MPYFLLNILLFKDKQVFSLHRYDSVKCMIYGYQISTIRLFSVFFGVGGVGRGVSLVLPVWHRYVHLGTKHVVTNMGSSLL